MSQIQPKVTADIILDWMQNAVAARKSMAPDFWLDCAMKLNILLSDEHDLLEKLRRIVAEKKLDILRNQQKKNVAAAELIVEASADYKDMKLQEHKVDRVEEFIRLAKINAKSQGGF